MTDTIRVHATAVAIDGKAILLRGPPGAGKSDLALRLIDGGASLVADDQAELRQADGQIRVTAPAEIAGLIEVRGMGILRLQALGEAPLALCVDLLSAADIERLPERRFEQVLGIAVPLIAMSGFEASAAAKLRLAIRAFSTDPVPGMLPTNMTEIGRKNRTRKGARAQCAVHRM